MTVVLPRVRADFLTTSTAVGWTATAQLLAVAVCTPLFGRVAELYRVWTAFCVSALVFGVASLGAGIAPGIESLVAARAAQGVGGAGLITLASVVVVRVIPPARQGWAFGLIASGTGIGQASGPALGGFVAQVAGWRAMFVLTAVLAGAVLAGGWRTVPNTGREPRARRSMDLLGALLLGSAVGVGLLAVTRIVTQSALGAAATGIAGQWGGWILAAVAVLFVAGFALRVAKAANPFVPPSLFRNGRFLATCAVGYLALYAFLATETLIPLLSADLNGLGSGAIGLVLLPGPAAIVLVSTPVGRITDRVGPRTVGVLGLLGLAAAALFLSTVSAASAAVVASGTLLVGLGFAFATIPALTGAAQVLPPEQREVGLGLFQSMYALGGACGAVLSPAVLDARHGAASGWNPFQADLAAQPYSDALLFVAAPLVLALILVPALPSRLTASATTTSRKGG